MLYIIMIILNIEKESFEPMNAKKYLKKYRIARSEGYYPRLARLHAIMTSFPKLSQSLSMQAYIRRYKNYWMMQTSEGESLPEAPGATESTGLKV